MSHLIKFLIVISILLMSCHTSNKSNQSKQDQPYTYLALGDSYTIGESVLEAERWPNQLVCALKKNGIDVQTARIIAKTGWTTDELLSALNDSIIDTHYDIVSLLIGVNNQYRGRSIENFKEEFIALLNKAIEYARNSPANIFVVSIPDWGVTPFAKNRDTEKIATEIDLFNRVIKEECLKRNIRFIDITDISRNVYKESGLIADDGLHPSGKMYGQWVNRIIPLLFEIVEN